MNPVALLPVQSSSFLTPAALADEEDLSAERSDEQKPAGHGDGILAMCRAYLNARAAAHRPEHAATGRS